jgi:hypothetical protein
MRMGVGKGVIELSEGSEERWGRERLKAWRGGIGKCRGMQMLVWGKGTTGLIFLCISKYDFQSFPISSPS